MTSTNTLEKQSPGIKLDHVGWITSNIGLFELFWVDALGFKQVNESFLTPSMGKILFESGPALIRRYRKDGWTTDIEIHQFIHSSSGEWGNDFQTQGINHICLHTGGPGSRETFLRSLPDNIQHYVYDNPKGWKNIFIRDYEGNWIELRENL